MYIPGGALRESADWALRNPVPAADDDTPPTTTTLTIKQQHHHSQQQNNNMSQEGRYGGVQVMVALTTAPDA